MTNHKVKEAIVEFAPVFLFYISLLCHANRVAAEPFVEERKEAQR